MPTIRFYCVLCGTGLRTATDFQDNLVECPKCLRNVPAPRLANVLGPSTGCPTVFPPEVLELSVKFQCTECHRRIRTDARWEGRLIVCPSCGDGTEVPRWSTVPVWQDPPEESKESARREPRAPVTAEEVTLSADEIDFLSGSATKDPEAAA